MVFHQLGSLFLDEHATLAENLSISGQPLFTVDGVSITFQNAGATTAQNEEYDRAIRYIDEAIMLTPRDGKLYTLLSGTYQRQGQEDKAREILEQGVLDAPDDPELHYFFALMLSDEEKDLALEHLKKIKVEKIKVNIKKKAVEASKLYQQMNFKRVYEVLELDLTEENSKD